MRKAKPQVVVLTGVAGSGKNTVAELLVKKRKRAAMIDVDQVRHMVKQPHRAPWSGAPGRKQRILGYENSTMLAKKFLSQGFDVIVLDVLEPIGHQHFKKSFRGTKVSVFLLQPTLAENLRRNKLRPKEFVVPEKHVRSGRQELLEQDYFDHRIDNTAMSPEKVARHINQLLD